MIEDNQKYTFSEIGKQVCKNMYVHQCKSQKEQGKLLEVLRIVGNPKMLDVAIKNYNLIKTLDHPNIVKYLDCVIEQGQIYIILEKHPNGRVLSELSQTTPNKLKLIYQQMKSAVYYMQEKAVSHKRIKLCSFYVANKRVVLTNFYYNFYSNFFNTEAGYLTNDWFDYQAAVGLLLETTKDKQLIKEIQSDLVVGRQYFKHRKQHMRINSLYQQGIITQLRSTNFIEIRKSDGLIWPFVKELRQKFIQVRMGDDFADTQHLRDISFPNAKGLTLHAESRYEQLRKWKMPNLNELIISKWVLMQMAVFERIIAI